MDPEYDFGQIFVKLCKHEAWIFCELLTLNVILFVLSVSFNLPYDYAVPCLVIFLLRTKRYDDNMFDDPFPFLLHLARICLLMGLLFTNIFVFGMLNAEVKPTVPRRISSFGFGTVFSEQIFLNTLFCLTVLTMRLFCQFAILCGSTIDALRPTILTTQFLPYPMGPSGDAPDIRVQLPVSQSFPAFPRRQVNVDY